MKYFLVIFIAVLFQASGFACSCSVTEFSTPGYEVEKESRANLTVPKMKITIGKAIFKAILNNNETANAFKARLPLRISMQELNGNEKFYDFQSALPVKQSNPARIQAGDLMLYGSSTLVLFYKSFSTTYSYTRIGRVEDPQGLAAALGSGDITILFEL